AQERGLAGGYLLDLLLQLRQGGIELDADAEGPEARGRWVAALVADDLAGDDVHRFVAEDVEVERHGVADLDAGAREEQRAGDAEIADDGGSGAVPALLGDLGRETRQVADAGAALAAGRGVGRVGAGIVAVGLAVVRGAHSEPRKRNRRA